MASSSQFRTFQTPQNYEEALARHGQWIRWMQGITCPCLRSDTGQADPQCNLCRGRGRIYKTPDRFYLFDERAKHDSLGRVFPNYSPVVPGSLQAFHKGRLLKVLDPQPANIDYVQLAPPYLKAWEVMTINYEWSPEVTVSGENSEVYSENVLRTIGTRFEFRGKFFEGSLSSVSLVYNVTKDETYTVLSAVKEYIYLDDMGAWEPGDVLSVNYAYVKPFNFLLVGVTSRMRYEQPYILDDADATLVTPYWAQVGPDDLLTAMAMERVGRAVIDPRVFPGNDFVNNFYDMSRIMRVVDLNGVSYTPRKDVEIMGRNELRWNVPKPKVKYSIQFSYHPTYVAMTNLHSLRNSENKAFVNRVSVKQFDRVHSRVDF